MQVGPSKSQPNTIRVLHVKAKSMPELNGYSIRGHEIIRAQLKSGDVYPTCITSPFYPSIKTMQIDSEIEGVRYRRSLPFDESKISASRRNFLRRELVGSSLVRLRPIVNSLEVSSELRHILQGCFLQLLGKGLDPDTSRNALKRRSPKQGLILSMPIPLTR